MDSFYDAPRRAPIPTQIEKFSVAPVVPEVSIIGTSKTTTNKYLSYNSWKNQQRRDENLGVLTSNRGNLVPGPQASPLQCPSPQNSSQFLKKVRFQSPILQQRPSLTNEPFNSARMAAQNSETTTTNVTNPSTEKFNPSQNNPLLNGTPFQQIYLSNVPNRNLDLSLIDLPIKAHEKIDRAEEKKEERKEDTKTDLKKSETNINICENKENMLPKTYREFLETQKRVRENKEKLNDSVTDIFNYRRKPFENESCIDLKSNNFVTEPSASKVAEFNFITEPNKRKYDCTASNVNVGNSKLPSIDDPKLPTVRQNNYENQYTNFSRQTYQNIPTNSVLSRKCDGGTQTSIAYSGSQTPDLTKQGETTKNDSEPTNRDLLKIIAQQNEQLLILQKQVAMLLNREDQHQPKQIEAPPQHYQRGNYLGEKCITSTQNEVLRSPKRDLINTPRKQRGLSKFSIDLMTSFEVAIRPQHKQNFNQEPKIMEVTESESGAPVSSVGKCDKTLVDTSLHLQEPLKVREVCPSPEPSININMNDYDSSDEDEVSASEIGATFYRNLMGQVNDILRKAQVQTKEDFSGKQNYSDSLRNQTMNRVKEATLKHLRNIGVTVEPIEEVEDISRRANTSSDYTPTEISFAVKQLLLKYLPDEQLAKITCKQTPQPCKRTEKPGIISTRPEFSFASVEYMKKYNLLSDNKDVKPKESEKMFKPLNAQKPEGTKILDMTALKMQPKLL